MKKHKRQIPDLVETVAVVMVCIACIGAVRNWGWFDKSEPEPIEIPEAVFEPIKLSEPVEETQPVEPPVAPVVETQPVEPPEPVAEPVLLSNVIVEPEPDTPVVEEPEDPELPYTDEELEMLALVIYQEAGADACSDDTRLKVGTVVMNRVADDRFPDTIYEVITAPYQYGRLHWTGIVWPDRASTEPEAHAVERAYLCAERILQGERFLPSDVVFQAEFTQGVEIVSEQDGFYFCR